MYRVLDLPSSMQSLVYDFGQLNTDTERSYAEKIVENYVMNNDTVYGKTFKGETLAVFVVLYPTTNILQ